VNFTLSDGTIWKDDGRPLEELPAEVRQQLAEAAERVERGENVTPIAPMCAQLLSLKRSLARAGRDEQEQWLRSIRAHHHICGCGKVDVVRGNEWIWEGD
jgi:hypothetical protein